MKEPLTVKELIKRLEELENQDAIISITSSNFELNGSNIPASSLYVFKGKIRKEGFRDAFDGGRYNTDVISWDDNEKEDFVQII